MRERGIFSVYAIRGWFRPTVDGEVGEPVKGYVTGFATSAEEFISVLACQCDIHPTNILYRALDQECCHWEELSMALAFAPDVLKITE